MNQIVKLAISRMEPTSTSAKIRQVMPEIEEKLAAGVRLGEIHKVLLSAGFNLSIHTLKTYIYRHRKKERPVARKEESFRKSVSGNDFLQRDRSNAASLAAPERFASREPLSIQNIDRLMKPSSSEQAEKLARYELLAKKNRRGTS